jgi:FkbM family methyltransferase
MARGGSVLAFEPDPLNYQMLQANLRLNAAARCEALRLALSDRAGTQTLYQYRQTNRGRHSMLPINAGGRIDVPTARLDDVLAERGWTSRRLRFMKIDIEGYELVCLRGATQTLARCEQLMLEFSPHTMRDAGLNPAELIDLLQTAGFVPHRLRGRAIEPTDWSTLAALDTQAELFLSRNPA